MGPRTLQGRGRGFPDLAPGAEGTPGRCHGDEGCVIDVTASRARQSRSLQETEVAPVEGQPIGLQSGGAEVPGTQRWQMS